MPDNTLRQMPPPGTNFLVAFSFAGQERTLVEAIAEACENRLGRGTVFYDEWYEQYLAGFGSDLVLQDIYRSRCQMIVLGVSGSYAAKPWTQIEHATIRWRVSNWTVSIDPRDRFRYLPVRVGEGEVPGIEPNSITVEGRDRPGVDPDDRRTSAERVADMIVWRLQQIDQALVPPPPAKGMVLMLPCSSGMVPQAAALATWLESQSIAVRRPEPGMPDADLSMFLARNLPQAAMLVAWPQRAGTPEDLAAFGCHQKVMAWRAALPPQERKLCLTWIDPQSPPAAAGDPPVEGARRMMFEQFKKLVYDKTVSPSAPERVVIGASCDDRSLVSQLLAALPDGTPRDSQYDPPPEMDQRLMKAIRKQVRRLVLVDGTCSRAWIEERLRAYDLFRESAASAPRLVVWDVPQPSPKPPHEFWPDDVELIATTNPLDVAAQL